VQHVHGNVEGGQTSIRVGLAAKELRVAAVATTRIEDRLAPAHVKCSRPDEPSGKRFMAGDKPSYGSERPWQPIVVLADEATVIEKSPPMRLARFQEAARTSR
jgi:hypothetical protein